jgi:predicted acetyltransferase
MSHEIHKVTHFEIVAPFTLRVVFEDATSQVINFRPVLHGELYGPLQDQAFLEKVRIDAEAQTLVWPNGADFDPAILYRWPEAGPELEKLTRSWIVSTTS